MDEHSLQDDGRGPYVLGATARIALAEWVREHQGSWLEPLARNGAVLFRGFAVETHEQFRDAIEAMSGAARWAPYREPATPRSQVAEHIFTSTEYPADQRIPLHNENSHCTSWPLKIFFYCEQPAASGGQTPLADCRRVLESLPADVVDGFLEQKWRYIRRFGGPLGFRWQKVFQTDDPRVVEDYCRENAMSVAWGAGDRLTVTYQRDAVHRHPASGENVWFNHGLFFNPVSLPPDIRECLTDQDLPYNTEYGDGTPVPGHVLAAIQRAYEQHTTRFDWQQGDVLAVDNMLMAHGRNPFRGARRVLVGMTDSHTPLR